MHQSSHSGFDRSNLPDSSPPNYAGYIYLTVMPPTKLSDQEIKAGIAQLSSGWSMVNAKLHKSFKFGDFVEAFGFMTKVAIVSEKLDHHPELFNVYNRVTIDLTTHDASGISSLDLELAKRIDAL